ncbi:MAG TPA: hypothetical protein VE133_03045 [Candidatus Sulfotelmatobacter sp.]|jgi:hypothetical protein|nr:hypothetical protein [Candidatus Sulfotelmatobacter sp.]
MKKAAPPPPVQPGKITISAMMQCVFGIDHQGKPGELTGSAIPV